MKTRGLNLTIFTKPEANNCFSLIAQVLSNSVLNHFLLVCLLITICSGAFKFCFKSFFACLFVDNNLLQLF